MSIVTQSWRREEESRPTRRVVVADGVPGVEAQNSAGGALDSSAPDLGRGLPYHLGEVAPVVEVGV